MPIIINKSPDPFSMTENEVNLAVAEFLKEKGASVLKVAIDREQGFDVYAEMNGYSFIVESKGSRRNNQTEHVFDSGQLKVHASAQIFYLMKKYESKSDKTFLIMANPDTPRIRNIINESSLSLNQLGFIRFWISSEKKIQIECPKELSDLFNELGLM